jgi:ribonuclease HI
VLVTGHTQVFDAELWANGLALYLTIPKRATSQRNGAKMVAIYSDSHTPFQEAEHLEPGTAQRLARRITRRALAFLAHITITVFNWVTGHFGISGHDKADSQANMARDAMGDTVI